MKPERTKEEILDQFIHYTCQHGHLDYTSTVVNVADALKAMEEYRQSSPVESDLIDYLKKEGKDGAEFRLIADQDGSAYIHVLGRDSETFDFKIR